MPEQFNLLATKEDWKNATSILPTKDELKEAVSGLATKKVDRLLIDTIDTRKELNELKSEVNEMKGDIKHLVSAVDGIVYELKSINSKQAANIAAHDRFEGRITTLEKQFNPKPTC